MFRASGFKGFEFKKHNMLARAWVMGDKDFPMVSRKRPEVVGSLRQGGSWGYLTVATWSLSVGPLQGDPLETLI